jgi:hypothetical protein
MIAYKIVRVKGKRRISTNICLPKRFIKQYKVKSVNRPIKGTKLFVFSNLAAAENFADRESFNRPPTNQKFELWEVRIPNTSVSLKGMYLTDNANILMERWLTNNLSDTPPSGTVGATSVKFVHKIKTY